MATYLENSCSFGLRCVSWYKYLIVGLVFSHLGFWSGNLFLIAPFPDLCLLVPFYRSDCFGLVPWLTFTVAANARFGEQTGAGQRSACSHHTSDFVCKCWATI